MIYVLRMEAARAAAKCAPFLPEESMKTAIKNANHWIQRTQIMHCFRQNICVSPHPQGHTADLFVFTYLFIYWMGQRWTIINAPPFFPVDFSFINYVIVWHHNQGS